jgi:hypothetical protein
LQDAEKIQSLKHRMHTLAYGEAMMAAAQDYGKVRDHCLSQIYACLSKCAGRSLGRYCQQKETFTTASQGAAVVKLFALRVWRYASCLTLKMHVASS